MSYPFLIIALVLSSLLLSLQAAKRLHDMGKSGALSFIFLIPFANILLAMLPSLREGTKGANRFGKDPKGKENSNMPQASL